MSEKRFELKVNKHNQCDIIDWEESEEKNAICIYNDLGDYYFSSAMALCKLLNEFYEKNKDLEEARSYYQENFLTMKTERNQLKRENKQLKQMVDFYKSFQKDARELEEENEQLKQLLKSINGSFTFDDNYVSWFKDCVIVSKEGLKEISLGSDLE